MTAALMDTERCGRGHERTPENTYEQRMVSSRGKPYIAVRCRDCRVADRPCRDCGVSDLSSSDSITGRCYPCQMKRVDDFEAMTPDQLETLVDLLTAKLALAGRR